MLIIEKSKCCGCSACHDICPKQAITMIEDVEGFLYPEIDESKCIHCGLCEKICPIKSTKKNDSFLKAYAAYNLNEDIRLKSSSGGIFTLIAENILAENGVVYGAAFDESFEVQHIRVGRVEELEFLRGSKYVQSKLDGVYNLCKKDLEIGRQVLFTGTPCQVSALKSFLRKDYANLVCMDIICHGVPSRMVWRKYLEYRVNFAKSKITQIAFRLKNEGWKQYAVKFTFANSTAYCQNHHEDLFMRGFLNNLYLRPSCYKCQFKSKERTSDVTVADFWGIDRLHSEWNDDKGMTLLVVHSDKGKFLLENIQKYCFIKEVDFDEGIKYNPAMVKVPVQHHKRGEFFDRVYENAEVWRLVDKFTKLSLVMSRIKSKIRRILLR